MSPSFLKSYKDCWSSVLQGEHGPKDKIKENANRFYKCIENKRVAWESVDSFKVHRGDGEKGKILNENFSAFTMEANEFRGGFSDIMDHMNITLEEVFKILKDPVT